METVYGIVLVVHLIGWALVLGGAVYGMRTVTLNPGILHGALTALVAGIIMTGLASAGVAAEPPNTVKIGVKLVIALIITGLAVYGNRHEQKVTRSYLGAIAGLTTANIAIAVLWS